MTVEGCEVEDEMSSLLCPRLAWDRRVLFSDGRTVCTESKCDASRQLSSGWMAWVARFRRQPRGPSARTPQLLPLCTPTCSRHVRATYSSEPRIVYSRMPSN